MFYKIVQFVMIHIDIMQPTLTSYILELRLTLDKPIW